MADAQHLPHGRSRAGDRHLKFHESRDNLGGDYAAVVQRNHISGGDQSAQPFTAVTLARAAEGRLVELQYLVSE